MTKRKLPMRSSFSKKKDRTTWVTTMKSLRTRFSKQLAMTKTIHLLQSLMTSRIISVSSKSYFKTKARKLKRIKIHFTLITTNHWFIKRTRHLKKRKSNKYNHHLTSATKKVTRLKFSHGKETIHFSKQRMSSANASLIRSHNATLRPGLQAAVSAIDLLLQSEIHY